MATPSAAMEAGGTTSYVISIIADDVALRHTPRTTFATTTVYLNVPRLRLSRAMVCTLSPFRFPAHLPPAYSVARSPASQLQTKMRPGASSGSSGSTERRASSVNTSLIPTMRSPPSIAATSDDCPTTISTAAVLLKPSRSITSTCSSYDCVELRLNGSSLKKRGSTDVETAPSRLHVHTYVSEVVPAFSPGQSATDACAKIVNFDGTSMS